MNKMGSIFNLLLLLSVVFNVSSHPLSHQKHGRCAGSAVNYLVSVPTFRECHKACYDDERCCHYSYHESEEGGHHCFLYNTEQCDINNLLIDAAHAHWRTGWMAECGVQNIFTRARKTLIRMWAAEENYPAGQTGLLIVMDLYWKNEEQRKGRWWNWEILPSCIHAQDYAHVIVLENLI